MRVLKFSLAMFATLTCANSAFAYENYLPLGTGYSSTVDSLPSFESETGQVNQQADVFETEIYLLGRKRIEQESRMRSFFSDAESTGVDTNIDY